MTEQTIYIQGVVFNETTRCTLSDLCRLCNVNTEMIHQMIAEGIISPEGQSEMEWRFTSLAIKRAQTTMRLHRDLEVNLPGCALILDLLDELQELRCLSRRR
ncbi:chaperone modulator CbpM [Desulfobulbus oligotrophicus]|jgi:chaperone modulatory protein CbpM|uniref:MerR family transcriptional regulator n=1 Tax=Desulfobulbus oligotrophicus TaxID=1909699 RepID=A0A7T5VCU7_9BACT|nr:chaperone modulator CbpM [Desulfobulbus oligotrophicus]MDY0389724.1 chaperone modulator CbpM [Desulfobulbus oligotrophicus]QQG65549.1 MerR family transcriptional regulator [Desulfobulbus oligotrophicus]